MNSILEAYRLKPILFGFFLFSILIAIMILDSDVLVKMGSQNSKIVAQCLRGTCWIQSKGSYEIQKIVENSEMSVAEGDTVLTMGQNSALLVSFREKKAELRLQNTAIVHIGKGHSQTFLDQGPDQSTQGQQEGSENKASIYYFNEIPIEIISPKKGVPILASKFPISLQLSLRLKGIESLKSEKLQNWVVAKKGLDGKWILISRIKLRAQSQGQGYLALYSNTEISSPGNYAFHPQQLFDKNRDSINPIEVEIKGAEDVEEQIKNLLDSSDKNPDGGLEIRSQ